MLRYETHQGEIDKIFNLINTGRFYSLTFIKKGDGQLRYLNGKRHIYVKPDGTEDVVKNIGYDPKNHNLIRIWDRNAENPYTKQRTGNYRSAALENILFVKSGADIFDFIEENQIIQRFPYIERQIPEIKAKMKIEDIVDDEAQGMMQEMTTTFDYQKLLGNSIEKTQQMIDKANADDIIAIEPDSTWETMYKFQKVTLMSTRLRLQYKENNGRGWVDKVEDVNVTQDRMRDFDEAKHLLSWIRKSINKGYAAEHRDSKAQDKLNLQETSEMLGISDLAELLERMKPDVTQSAWQDFLQQLYQEEGDEEIRKFFYGATKGTDLQILGRGKYALKF